MEVNNEKVQKMKGYYTKVQNKLDKVETDNEKVQKMKVTNEKVLEKVERMEAHNERVQRMRVHYEILQSKVDRFGKTTLHDEAERGDRSRCEIIIGHIGKSFSLKNRHWMAIT